MKKMSIIISSIFFVTCLIIVILYLLKQNLDKKDNEIKKLTNDITSLKEDMNKRIGVHNEKISIIEASIEPINQRWVKIKKIRKIIQDDLKSTNSLNKFSVKDITDISSAVVDYSDQYDLPMHYILAIIKTESGYNSKAISKTSAKGLMQLMDMTAKECAFDLGKKYFNVFNAKDNIQLGSWYFSKMLIKFDYDYKLAINAYNCGAICVEKVESKIWDKYPEETIYYLTNILRWKEYFEQKGL
jgi:membrane-bound lytic murein transglycosylase MltF